MAERDWEKIFVLAFCKLDSDQPGEAVAALNQLRQIATDQGITFRSMIERLQESLDPAEAQRLQARIDQLALTNKALGLQHEEMRRENTKYRAFMDKHVLRRRFVKAAGWMCLSIVSMGQPDFLRRNWDIFAIPAVAAAPYCTDFVTLGGALFIGGVATMISSAVRESGKLFFWGLAFTIPIPLAVFCYDNLPRWNEKTEDAIVAARDLGPATYSVNYNIGNKARIITLVGQTIPWRPPEIVINGKSQPLLGDENSKNDKGLLLTCTMYWRATADVKLQDLSRTPPPKPDLTKKPYRTVGMCGGLVRFLFDSNDSR